MRTWRATLIATIVLCSSAFAADQPNWIKESRHQDSDYFYYVGRSSAAANEASGFSESLKDAYDQAIRENFGFQTNIETESYSGLDKASTTKRIRELSQGVEIHDFEQVNSYNEALPDGHFNVWTLYKYKKSAASAEKVRLSTVKAEDKKITFSEIGVVDDAGGTLEIVTTPPKARIFIDGEPAGLLRTPLRISGQLSTGEHILRIEHPQFESVEEKIVIVPKTTVHVNKVLVKATGFLNVITTPPNANVLIGGKPAGISPVEHFSVPAGVPLIIEISHAEAERYSQTIEVQKGIARDVVVNLPLKPAYVSAWSKPDGGKVTIDSQDRGATPTGTIQLAAGIHHIEVSKEGFETVASQFTIRGGETKVLPPFVLPSFSDRKMKERADDTERMKRLASPPITLGLGGVIASSPVVSPNIPTTSVRFSAEYKPSRWFGTNISFDSGSNRANYSNASLGIASYGTRAGISIYPVKSIFIRPQAGLILNKYTLTYTSDAQARAVPMRNQFVGGGSLGYRYLASPSTGSRVVWGAEFGVSVERVLKSSDGAAGAIPVSGSACLLLGF